jgi:hypothetical protein
MQQVAALGVDRLALQRNAVTQLSTATSSPGRAITSLSA